MCFQFLCWIHKYYLVIAWMQLFSPHPIEWELQFSLKRRQFLWVIHRSLRTVSSCSTCIEIEKPCSVRSPSNLWPRYSQVHSHSFFHAFATLQRKQIIIRLNIASLKLQIPVRIIAKSYLTASGQKVDNIFSGSRRSKFPELFVSQFHL